MFHITPQELIKAIRGELKELRVELVSYEDALENTKLLVKELDAAWNGDNVVENPELCDLVFQIKTERSNQKLEIKTLINLLRAVNSVAWIIPELEKHGWTDMQDEKGIFERVEESLK